MIYNFNEDFCKMKTTVYLYNEYTDSEGNFKQLPLSKPLKEDRLLSDILCGFKLNWVFKNSKYGNNIKEVTLKARTHAHGSLEYNDIKMRMPGYTWAGTIIKEDILDEENQEFYERRKGRSKLNIIPNGLVCIEFDDVESNKVSELIQKALTKFPHLVYAGRTLSNKLFCMHRADEKLNNNNYERYYKELAVLYHNELGIEHDSACKDISRCRYMCDQFGARANMEYCDFGPSNNIEVEYDKLFKKDEITHIKRASGYIPKADESIYEYDKEKGFYYGHGTNHMLKIGDIIVPVPTIAQMINTLLAIGKTKDEICELWEDELNYYNYNTESRDVTDVIRFTKYFNLDCDEYIIGQQTYLFLQMFFPEIVGCNSFFLAKNEFLCDRYYEFLQNAILTHNKILIHGDTGIGKTYFANRLNENNNVIVVVPYIAHMDNYPVYKQIEINKEIKEVVSNGVIIWDRFVILYEKGLIDKNSIIIIDESHKLFLDQTYRAAAIKMNTLLKEISNHICYISATPIKEVDVEITYRFEKERRPVNVNHMKIIMDEGSRASSNLTINAMLHLIYGNINYYDHIFIASDLFAQKLYDRLYGKYDCQLIRANQKDSKEYLDLMKTQLLKHKIIIGTCISYESLNFNNKNEKILTIADMNETTTAERITQIAGRVRFSYNKAYFIDVIKTISDVDYKEMALFYDKLEEIKSKYNLYSKRHYVQTYAEELEEVNKWYYESNDIDTIKKELPSYIKWTESEILASNVSDKSPLNEKVKEYVIDYISKYKGDFRKTDVILEEDDISTLLFFGLIDFIKINETGQSAYIIRENIRYQQYEYEKLSQYVNYEKINKMIIESHTMPKGLHSEINHIIDIIKLQPIEYNAFLNDLISYRDSISYQIGYNILNDTIKNIKKIKDVYEHCYDENEYIMYDKIFDRYSEIRSDIFKKKQSMWSKIGSRNTKAVTVTEQFKHPEKYNLHVGQHFASWKELSTYTNKSIKTISTWKNKCWIQ